VPSQPQASASTRHTPEVVRVGVETLRQLRALADGEVDELQRNALRLELDYLIRRAEEIAWPL